MANLTTILDRLDKAKTGLEGGDLCGFIEGRLVPLMSSDTNVRFELDRAISELTELRRQLHDGERGLATLLAHAPARVDTMELELVCSLLAVIVGPWEPS
jgi:hypothetical protein